MSSPVPGWYADPAGGGDERWWDGSRWTGNVRPGPAPAPAVPSGPYGAVPTGPYGTEGAYVPADPRAVAPGAGFGGYGEPQPPAPKTFVQRNGYSLAAIGVAVLYAVIAFEFRIVLLGILPVVFGVRALRRREPLGVVGLVVGVLVLVLALYELRGV